MPDAAVPKQEPSQPVANAGGMPVIDISYDIEDGSDDMPTIVTSVDQYHVLCYAGKAESGATTFEGSEESSEAIRAQEASDSAFLVTTRIVIIHSDGVITAS